LSYGPDQWLQVHFLLQAQYQSAAIWDADRPAYAVDETDSDATWDSTFRIRRARIILKGQVAKNVSFFVETDDYNRGGRNNAGAAGGSGEGTFIQDAFVSYDIAPEFKIAMGMILLPFMHHNRQSAVSLLGVDYNTDVVKFMNNRVWRDTGIEVRGLLAGGVIDYRLGVFQGQERELDVENEAQTDRVGHLNENAAPRFVGRIQLNLMDAEDGFFYSGNYLGKKKIVSIGGGIDYQSNAGIDYDAQTATPKKIDDYLAWTIDLTIDYALAPGTVFALQGAYVAIDNRWSRKTKTRVNGTAIESYYDYDYYGEEYGYFVQAGLLLMNTIQPVIKYSTWVNKDATALGDNTSTYLTFGLNYFINGHNANIKIEYRHPLGENESISPSVDQIDTSGQQQVTLQAQIFI
ncbi:MAG TPA: porin, partial [Spirochaetota bacterium]|nr:porin [Spirochaetota bacterium]